jgi:hypothetical protein
VQVQRQWLDAALARASTAQHRSQDAGCIGRRSFDDDSRRAGHKHICGALCRIAGDNERRRSDEATQRFIECCRHRCRGVTKRTVSVIEELDVKVLPATFESHEEETGASLANL